MEFYRGVLIPLINLYFESRDEFHKSFDDACRFFAASFSIRKVKLVLLSTLELLNSEGFDVTAKEKKELCRQKLSDLIFLLAEELQSSQYKNVGITVEKCTRFSGHLKLSESDRESLLFEFVTSFNDVKAARSSCRIHKFLTNRKFDDYFSCVAKGIEKELAQHRDSLAKERADPVATTCHRCSKLGDIVIAANAPTLAEIHTLDSAFVSLGKCLGRTVVLHASVQQLRDTNSG